MYDPPYTLSLYTPFSLTHALIMSAPATLPGQMTKEYYNLAMGNNFATHAAFRTHIERSGDAATYPAYLRELVGGTLVGDGLTPEQMHDAAERYARDPMHGFTYHSPEDEYIRGYKVYFKFACGLLPTPAIGSQAYLAYHRAMYTVPPNKTIDHILRDVVNGSHSWAVITSVMTPATLRRTADELRRLTMTKAEQEEAADPWGEWEEEDGVDRLPTELETRRRAWNFTDMAKLRALPRDVFASVDHARFMAADMPRKLNAGKLLPSGQRVNLVAPNVVRHISSFLDPSKTLAEHLVGLQGALLGRTITRHQAAETVRKLAEIEEQKEEGGKRQKRMEE
jgi:hypothetical protein